MPHVLTITLTPHSGLSASLECTEPADASKSRCRQPYPEQCTLVEIFDWDSAGAIEGFNESDPIDVAKLSIKVLTASEDEFEWELAGESPEPASVDDPIPVVSECGDGRG